MRPSFFLAYTSRATLRLSEPVGGKRALVITSRRRDSGASCRRAVPTSPVASRRLLFGAGSIVIMCGFRFGCTCALDNPGDRSWAAAAATGEAVGRQVSGLAISFYARDVHALRCGEY